PSIDVLFRSVAIACGPRSVGVLLSGSDDDGASGLSMIQHLGGTTIVQDPDESLFPDMPGSALRHFDPDYKMRVADMPPLLDRLVRDLSRGEAMSIDGSLSPREQIPEASEETLGVPSAFTCPDCGGALWEVEEGELLRFRCRVGHAFSPSAMLDAESDTVDKALWTAIRVLKA